VLNDFISIKKPEALRYFKKKSNGDQGPFESATSVEFFSQKSDASLFVFGSHSKKRPHNLVLGRLFDFHVLDMMEFGVTSYKSIANLGASKLPMLGSKPCFTIVGAEFHSNLVYAMAANLIVDFFRGRIVENVSLAGLDHVISLSVKGGVILFRHFSVHMKKSGGRVPRVELEEVGPSLDLVLRRHQFGDEALRKQALKKPKELNPRKQKNISTTTMHDQVANVHIPKQNVEQIEKQAVKPKALKRPSKKRKRESVLDTQQQQQIVQDAETQPQKKLKSTVVH